ncbi:MAG TPA: phosphopantetheine-binding protein [Acidobacteriota bacterium]|nr:phosphopantetheine-binding protein [Acidobacteriota bacterium]
MTIQERAIAAISKGCSRKAREINIDTLFDQLDVDSVDRLQILFELEEEFDIVIPDKVARRATSVREVVEKLTEFLQPANE